jgi:putative ABC transport system ATP-binding protein
VMPDVATYIKMDKGSNLIFQGILIFLILFTIFNTLSMSVLERQREFAMLMAVGTTPGRLRLQVLVETIFLGLIGCFFGLLLGGITVLYGHLYGINLSGIMGESVNISGFALSSRMYTKVSLDIFLGSTITVFAATLLLGLIPVRRATRISIVDTLRWENAPQVSFKREASKEEKMKEMVQTQNLTKDYGQDGVVTRALRGVTVTLAAGEFAAMAGPSGSGKSTLLNIIGGLDRPTSGTARVQGRELSGMSGSALSRLRRDNIGFIFQAYNLIPVLTALENAEYVLMLQGVPSRKREERVRAILKEVGLEGLENRFPRQLSGGQQQRVAIARAIASEPSLVLADEPTANVDSKTARSLLKLMRRLNEEKGITFLFSTHDQAVMKEAKRLILLQDGQIIHEDHREEENYSR